MDIRWLGRLKRSFKVEASKPFLLSSGARTEEKKTCLISVCVPDAHYYTPLPDAGRRAHYNQSQLEHEASRLVESFVCALCLCAYRNIASPRSL